jgi:hypothetical protein
MAIVTAFFLLAPLVLVPLGLRLIAVAAPGYGPPPVAIRLILPAGIGLALSFGPPAGPVAALLALPWLAVTGGVALAAGVRWLRDPDRFRPGVRHVTDAAVVFLAVGATFAVISRLGVPLLGFPAELTVLSAVHFHFAGFVLPLAGALAYRNRPRRWLAVALATVILGIPLTAIGFLGLPLANWTGALLTAGGAFGIGLATALLAGGLHSRGARLLAAVAGLCLLVSMPMAVIHATGVLVGTTWLDLATMARVHGALNSVGFGLAAMLAWSLEHRAVVSAAPVARSEVARRRLRGRAGEVAP